MSYKTYFDTAEVRVCCTCQFTPTFLPSADTHVRRRVATFPCDWICEPTIHPTWSTCPSRRQINGSRLRSLHAPSVPLPVRRAMSRTKSDYRADGGSTRLITRLLFPISPLSFHVHATPPRARRCHPAPRLLFCTCTCTHPYACAAPLSCVYPGPSGCCQRS